MYEVDVYYRLFIAFFYHLSFIWAIRNPDNTVSLANSTLHIVIILSSGPSDVLLVCVCVCVCDMVLLFARHSDLITVNVCIFTHCST